MADAASPYARVAGRLRDMGYHAMPAKPGEKVPGHFEAGRWSHMARWQDWCGRMPPEFLHERWESWPDAGVCIAHGAVVGARRRHRSPRRRRRRGGGGAARRRCAASGPRAGWATIARARDVTARGARAGRWYRHGGDGGDLLSSCCSRARSRCCRPRCIPQTGQPYRWLTPDTLEDTLPRRSARAARRCGRTARRGARQAGHHAATSRSASGWRPRPRRRRARPREGPVPLGQRPRPRRALGRWLLALGLPKARQRAGSWEAVPAWRSSSSGRPLEERSPNLRATPSGIRDWGNGEGHTAIDVVMRARGCSFDGAVEWLEPFLASRAAGGDRPRRHCRGRGAKRAAARSCRIARRPGDPTPQSSAPVDSTAGQPRRSSPASDRRTGCGR